MQPEIDETTLFFFSSLFFCVFATSVVAVVDVIFFVSHFLVRCLFNPITTTVKTTNDAIRT